MNIESDEYKALPEEPKADVYGVACLCYKRDGLMVATIRLSKEAAQTAFDLMGTLFFTNTQTAA